MKRQFLLLPLIITGCTSAMMGSSRNEKHQTEIAIHKTRTDLEELKCELNSVQSQLEILENKLNNQDAALTGLKQDIVKPQQAKLENLSQSMATLEKQCKRTHKNQEQTLAHFKELSEHANDAQTALSQYKNKIVEVEHQLAHQEKEIKEIAKLKQIVEELSQFTLQISANQGEHYESKKADSADRG